MQNKKPVVGAYKGRENGLHDYKLVVRADNLLQEKLVVMKKTFYDEYGETMCDSNSVCSPAYITIASFFSKEEMETTFIRWIQRICRQFYSFPVTLNNFSGIPEHTIHLRVQDTSYFKAFIQQLEPVNAFISACSCQLHVVDKPYLPLVTELPGNIYAQAIPDYSQQTFHESFMANELILLKRKNQFEYFKTVTVFNFLPATEERVA